MQVVLKGFGGLCYASMAWGTMYLKCCPVIPFCHDVRWLVGSIHETKICLLPCLPNIYRTTLSCGTWGILSLESWEHWRSVWKVFRSSGGGVECCSENCSMSWKGLVKWRFKISTTLKTVENSKMGNCHRNSASGREPLRKYSIFSKLFSLSHLLDFSPPCKQGKLNARIKWS